MKKEIIGRRIVDQGEPEKPGEFIWLYDAKGMTSDLSFMCPCGCGKEQCIVIYLAGSPKPLSPSWAWDGDSNKPTLSPSINIRGCGWHGFLKEGVFRRV